MLSLHGKPVIEHQIKRLKPAVLPNIFALATTILPEDEVLCEVARRCDIESFRGSVGDVVERLLRAAQHYQVEFIACVGGDDVFSEAELVDAVIAGYADSRADFITISNLPFGATPFGVTARALERVLEIKGSGSTDGWERYLTETGLFRTEVLHLNDPELDYPNLRLDLDYPEDFELMKAVYDRLYQPGCSPSLREVVRLLVRDEPSLVELNREAHQKWLATRAKIPLHVR